jgi:O-antigen/teichoic acid export membrane protein
MQLPKATSYSDTYIRIIKAVGAHSLGVAVSTLARVIYPPMFLHVWGVEIYGEWLLLSSAVLYLLLADFGGQLYIGNRMAAAYANGNQEEFQRLLHTGIAMFILISLAVFFLFVVGVSLTTNWSAISIVHTSPQIVVAVMIFMGLQVCVSLPFGILMAVYRAVGMLPRSAMLNNLNQLLQLLLVTIGLWFGLGMVEIALIHSIPIVIVLSIALRELHLLHPELHIFSLRFADRRMALDLVKPSAHFFSIQLSQAMTLQSVLLIVGATFGASQVVLFSALRTITNSIRQVLAIFMNSVWPDLTRFHAKGDEEKLILLFRISLRITLVLVTLFVSIFHYLGEGIFNLWLGGNVEYRQYLMDLFLLYIFQFIFWTSCSNLLMSINHHHEISILLLVSALATVIAVFVGGQIWGLAGVIGGLICADLALPFWAVPMLLRKYILGISLRFFLNELLPTLLAIGLIMWTPWAMPPVALAMLAWLTRALPKGGVLKRYRFLN